jgi:hypothetical protein
MSNIDDEIRAKTDAFANDLTVLVRRTAMEAVVAALGDRIAVSGRVQPPVAAAAKKGLGRPRKIAPAVPAASTPAAPKPATVAPAPKAAVPERTAPKRAPGAKRTPSELATLTAKLAEFIKANPGARMEMIAKALATPAIELRFPARKLVAAERIRTEGQKQNTVYFPA